MRFKLLIFIVILSVNSVCQANSEDDIKWATDLGNRSTEMVWQNLKEQFAQQEELEEEFKSESGLTKRPAGLYIFVSSSMSKSLLKSYFDEAKFYGGVLVFKGLPRGSFKELIKLVRELAGDEENQAAMQIDDEAFESFGIKEVPAIILTKENEYAPNQSLPLIYDKITGNVGIRYALERFGGSGELAEEASEYLHGFKNK